MTREERIELKETIQEEIAKLEKEIAELSTRLKPIDPDCLPENVSHEERAREQTLIFHRYDEARKRLHRLTAALPRIERSDYGICEECEEEIPLERLKIAPESRYCIACLQEMQK